VTGPTFRDALQNYLGTYKLREILLDNSQLLNDVANGLNELGPALVALIDENRQLRSEDAAESNAATRVKEAFDNVAGNFASDEVPDVEPLPADEPTGEPPTPVDQPTTETGASEEDGAGAGEPFPEERS
jgi:hypothetical protein